MQKHNDAMKTIGHSSLEKYTSHFIERVVCERELETEQKLQYIDPPTLLAITAFLGGARGVMVIVIGNGHGDTSSNPGWD